jgi:hypothetical protein
MQAEVALLSSDELGGRAPGFTGDLRVRRYIEERFRSMGTTAPGGGCCYQQVFANDNGDPTANVVAIIPGSDPAVSDQIMAIGQAIKGQGVPPRRTIALVAFGSEETGLEGSVFYVANPPAELPMSKVVYMVNLDMLGTYDVAGGVDAFGSFAGTPGRELLDALLTSHADLAVNLGIASPEGDSDYDPFCDLGIPYVYFETFDDPCWHEACDDADRIDAPHLAELSMILYDVVVGLANRSTDLLAVRDMIGCSR